MLPIIAVTADAINKVPVGPALFSDVELKPVNMGSLLDKIRSNPEWIRIRAQARTEPSLQVSHCEHMTIIEAIEARDHELQLVLGPPKIGEDHLIGVPATPNLKALCLQQVQAGNRWE